MAGTSETSICNQALGWLGGNLITSFDDPSVEAQLCKSTYELSRDRVLEERDWSFAITRRSLSPLTPADGQVWQKFTLPADCIRVLLVSSENTYVNDIPWSKEENIIIANTKVLYIQYLFRLVDPVRFSAGFINCLATRLAADMAIALTQNTKVADWYEEKYIERLENAGAYDGMQGINQDMGMGRLVDSRWVGPQTVR